MQRSPPGLMLSPSDGPANPPRPEKSGAKVRFLVDPTIGWRRHEWRFRVESRPQPGSKRMICTTTGSPSNHYLITDYPQPSKLSTNHEHSIVSAGLNDG